MMDKVFWLFLLALSAVALMHVAKLISDISSVVGN